VEKVRGSTGGVKVRGLDNLLIRFAQCCQPVPGDPITGYITRGRGVSIHRKDCPNIVEDLERRIAVSWDVGKDQSFLVGLKVYGYDRTGLLGEISKTITDSNINITSAAMKTVDGLADGQFTIEVEHLKLLERVIRRIKKLKGVDRVERLSSGNGMSDDVFDHLKEVET
jgi:GTP pyrophosphokinase